MVASTSDFDKIYDQLIKEADKTNVVFINGILTNEGDFNNKIVPAIESSFNLKDTAYKKEGSNYGGQFKQDVGYVSSLWFNPIYNNSFVDEKNPFASWALLLLDTALNGDKWRNVFEDFKQFKLLEAAGKILEIKDANLFFANSKLEQFKDFLSLAQQVISSGGDFNNLANNDDFWAKMLDFLVDFIPYGDRLDNLIKSVPDYFDGKEALNQYWFKDTQYSSAVNPKWVPDISQWVGDAKNSVMLIGHSQGNFF